MLSSAIGFKCGSLSIKDISDDVIPVAKKPRK